MASLLMGRSRTLCYHTKGGLGEVSLAHDEELERDLALKWVPARAFVERPPEGLVPATTALFAANAYCRRVCICSTIIATALPPPRQSEARP